MLEEVKGGVEEANAKLDVLIGREPGARDEGYYIRLEVCGADAQRLRAMQPAPF